MASPPDNRWPRPRWTTLIVIVAACAIGAVGSRLLQRPPVERLAEAWGRTIAEQDEAQAIASVWRLSEFEEAAIPWWAEVLADPREEVVLAASAALDRETARWQSLGEDAVAQRWEKLIHEIEGRRSRLTPTAWRHVATLVRGGIAATHGIHSIKRTPFLLAADSLLREAPIHAIPSELKESIVASEPMTAPSGEDAALMALASPGGSNRLTDKSRSKSEPPPAYTARLDRRAPKILTQGEAEEGPREKTASVPGAVSEIGSLGGDLGKWSEIELMQALQSSDRYLAASVAKELRARGYRDVHLDAAQRLFDADPHERRRLVDELPSIEGIDPRLWLEQLAQDENESVRTAAEATLSTARQSKGKKPRTGSR